MGGDQLTGWDLLGIATGFCYMLLLVCFLSRGRIFWEDELLGWMLLRDPSWHHMVWAWRAGADGGGFAFYLTGRGWFRIFGQSVLSFRLYSATCFGLAFAVTWAAARRYYSVGIVSFALLNTWFFSSTLIQHAREGRFYGLLAFSISLAFWLVLVLAEVPKPTPLRFYLYLFATHALLTTSHPLGAVFSAFLLGATIALDRLAKRWRPQLYVCGAAAWLLLVPERQNIIASAAVGKPHFWTKAPTIAEFVGVYTGGSSEIAIVLGALAVVAVWSMRRSAGGVAAAVRHAFLVRRPVYIATSALLAVSIALFIEGLLGTWLFNNRYLLPLTIGDAYLTAELLTLSRPSMLLEGLMKHPFALRALQAAGCCVFVVSLLVWDFHHLHFITPAPQDYTVALNATLPSGVPVVCEDAFTFTELLHRQHATGVRYIFLLDPAHSIAPSAAPLEAMQYHLMENWRKVGYFSGSIEPIDEFLRKNSQFFVVGYDAIHPDPATPPEIGNPLAERFAHDPGYQVRRYAHLDRIFKRDTIWLVCRHKCES